MKPKTFTYNQIIQFFTKHGLPLSDKQLHLVTEYNRWDNAKIEETRKRQEAKKAGKRFRRKMERENISSSNRTVEKPPKSVNKHGPI
jgi:hypothetical protein